jgi:hypothetical protein
MKQLEVGNKIRVKNWMNDYVVTIVRVTKTQAIGDKYGHRFRRNYNDGFLRPVSSEKYSTTSYQLL